MVNTYLINGKSVPLNKFKPLIIKDFFFAEKKRKVKEKRKLILVIFVF
ncbi:hypothetical protein KCQ_05446 [Pectobacterium atrosepticum ICMP 1526]|nr:hypothetical protein KCQ_05446 [Pectobacterium atrosepticum ICMP 1526]